MVFIGETEVAGGTVTFKDFQARTQENVSVLDETFFMSI